MSARAVLSLSLLCSLLHSAAALAEDGESTPSVVHVESTRTGTTVALVKGTATGTGYASNGTTATVVTTYYEDMCIASCDAKLDPGLRELMFYGPGQVAGRYKDQFDPGETTSLLVKPGSAIGRFSGLMLTSLGLSAVLLGALQIDEPETNNLLMGGGAVLTIGGGALYILNGTKITAVAP